MQRNPTSFYPTPLLCEYSHFGFSIVVCICARLCVFFSSFLCLRISSVVTQWANECFSTESTIPEHKDRQSSPPLDPLARSDERRELFGQRRQWNTIEHGESELPFDCAVTDELAPVCGSDGVTYNNPSEARCQ